MDWQHNQNLKGTYPPQNCIGINFCSFKFVIILTTIIPVP